MTDKIIAKKERRFHFDISLMTIGTILFYCFLIFIIYILFDHKYIIVYLTNPTSKNEGYFFTILVSIMMLLFLVSCGFAFELTSTKWKVLIFLFICWLLIQNFTNIGFGIRFRRNYNLLIWDRYESNSKYGIRFFILNFLVFWIWIYIISLFFESEKKS